METEADIERRTKKDVVISLLEKGCTISGAAGAVGVHRATLYRWRDRDTDFASRMEGALDKAVAAVKQKLFHLATQGGNLTAAIFFLCNRRKDEWSHVQRIQLAKPEEEPVQIVIAPAKAPGEIEASATESPTLPEPTDGLDSTR